ncbi:MAG: protein translocase subunit SecF [Treponema sp.]|jgi:preprotein translocase subunit SecF|nr:protein translocase subunit SecF [Treponema sp.]
MKRIIRFSRFFIPAAVISTVLAVGGIVGFIAMGGFNLGVDFQAGLLQEVRFAPTAFSLTWTGRGAASVSFDRSKLDIVISGAGVESQTLSFPFAEYGTVGALAGGIRSNSPEGLSIEVKAPADAQSQWLIFSAQVSPLLGTSPFVVHYLSPGSAPIAIREVRESLVSLGRTVSVQQIGQDADRHFMIRLEDSEIEEDKIPAERIISVLENYFGQGGVAVIRSDYVGSRFSKDLTDQAGMLLALTLLLILVYSSVRFKPQFAIGAVLAIIHDGLIMVAFVVWSRMEFNTTTIAAILTILGYSINDTIVIFDRIRETRRIYPEDPFLLVLDRSLSETLSRTIITTATTILAVIFLFVFTTGSMKDFALALLVGMISGVYSTIFIASGFVYFWDVQAKKRELNKREPNPVKVGKIPLKAQARQQV